jgi:hypothetical protein
VSYLKSTIDYLAAGHLAKAAKETVEAAALTEPTSSGPKVDVDWRAGYIRMLCEIPDITQRRARCVATVFPTLSSLLAEVSSLLSTRPSLLDVATGDVLIDSLTPKFASLASMAEPESSDKGADRTSRKFGVGNVLKVIRGVATPFDPDLLTG